MFYVDSQRTITRRDSSLIVPDRRLSQFLDEGLSTTRGQSSARLGSEFGVSLDVRPKGSVQKELVTLLFESMLDSIVESWEVLVPQKPEESAPNIDLGKTASELTFSKKKGKGKDTAGKTSRAKDSRSKIEFSDGGQVEIYQCWWSAPDERALIRFRNGNIYEGNISMKCMHGEGRFQWADGTVYLGQFKENEMNGKGMIQWKDDTWYEGDFVGNLRHGHGLYVDSRRQRSYAGDWHCGTKHGRGAIYYSKTFKNSYDGEWVHNVRHGIGSREYCAASGYKGQWDQYTREGKGLMIWPNHDFYRGEWKNGVMSGCGIYIWDAYYNNTMSLPSVSAFRGQWFKGKRNGYGVLDLGLGLGSHYKGEFKDNLKHGVGKFVTNNGLILQNKKLFIDDNLWNNAPDNDKSHPAQDGKRQLTQEPFQFDICDDTVGLLYHIEEALKNFDREEEIRTAMITEYFENNKDLGASVMTPMSRKEEVLEETNKLDIEDLIRFEETSLRKSLRCYETELRQIYYRYATICNEESICFTPILIRMYLWQLYFDCNMHEKGLTLVQIDRTFYRNPEWIARTPHNPFEKIYYWQFLHSLITVASKLYAKRQFPGTKPDTILAGAFRTFMENDILPGAGRCKGYLANGYGGYIPLRGLYELYRQVGEPHTIRAFMCAARRPAHDFDHPQPPLIDAPDSCLPVGRNAYAYGDEMTFVTDELVENYIEANLDEETSELKLFNFGNLSCKTMVKIFARIFPQLIKNGKIMNLETEITFYEFFEAFIACTEESIREKEEELRLLAELALQQEQALLSTKSHTTQK